MREIWKKDIADLIFLCSDLIVWMKVADINIMYIWI